MTRHFPSPADDCDNVVFALDSGIKLIGRKWVVEFKFGEECILKDESVSKHVPGFCFELMAGGDTCIFFVVNCKDTLKAYQELKEHQRVVVALIDDSYLSSILINEGSHHA